MKALIFAEGGPGVGLGHLRRCSSLADAMVRRGWDCEFLSLDPGARAWLASKNCRFASAREPSSGRLPDADYSSDVFVVDSYKASNEEIIAKARPRTRLIVAFDGMLNRHKSADVIISTGILAPRQSWPRARSSTSRAAPGANARQGPGRRDLPRLLGPTFHPLAAEYLPLVPRELGSEVRSVLITMGGLGHFAVMKSAIKAVRKIFPQASIDCVVGPFADSRDEMKDVPDVRWHRNPPSLKPFLLACDLAVAGSGQTLFELAATGTPAVAVGLAENQRENLMGMEEAGIVLSAGWSDDPGFESALLERLIKIRDSALRRKLSVNGQRLVDGRGASRIAEAIEKLLPGLKTGGALKA